MNIPHGAPEVRPAASSLRDASSIPPVKRMPLLLPAAVLRPWVVLLVSTLPQLLLLLTNLRAWDLASGDMNPLQRTAAGWIFAAQCLPLVAGFGLAIWLWMRKENLRRWQGMILLVSAVIPLGASFVLAAEAIPPAIAEWMLPREGWIQKQFVLLMPSALYGALRILCPDRLNRASLVDGPVSSVGMATGLIVGSVSYLILGAPFSALFRGGSSANIFTIFLTAGYIAIASLAAAAVLRICIDSYVRLRAASPIGLAAFSAVVALGGPFAGLALNSIVPFPVDFQIVAIYILAAATGTVLLLPNFANPSLHRFAWLLQCGLFPFTVYFFAVFLPFVPVAPLGALAFGGGLLIYVPSLLFLLHGYRIIDGFQMEIRDGSWKTPAILGLVAVAAWPAAFTISARSDRSTLHGALDYLRYPDYSEGSRYTGNLTALRSTLLHLRDFKNGSYLPYVSEYYNWLAFDGMVLPDSKMKGLFESFFGTPLPETEQKVRAGVFMRGTPRNVTEAINGVQGTRPRSDAVIDQISATSASADGVIKTMAELTISNPTATPTEFLTQIAVPPGVMISGMWLMIGTEKVPGRIFEKRAAEWVYQKISEVRPVPRDPAILRYVGPNSAELRVFPVESGTPRHVAVEFSYPENLNPDIRIQSRSLDLRNPMRDSGPSVATSPDGWMIATIPASVSANLPAIPRNPVLHLIVDFSEGSRYTDSGNLRTAIQKISASLPEAAEVRIEFMNFESQPGLDGRAVPLRDVLALSPEKLLSGAGKPRGGFLPERAIKAVLWQNHQALSSGDPAARAKYPQIVVLNGTGRKPPADETAGLSEFARLLPDFPAYWTFTDGQLQMTPLDSSRPPESRRLVHLFQLGDTVFLGPKGEDVSCVTQSKNESGSTQILYFDPAAKAFVPWGGALTRLTSGTYVQGIVPWGIEFERIFEPFRDRKNSAGRLLSACRASGVLVPSAAYMVAESSAQWKMLERTEKKTSKGHESLALADDPAATPEPGTIGLVALGILGLLAHHWKQRRSAHSM